VYVSYGVLSGDCGAYHGWVMGAPVAPGEPVSYRVPCGRACGLWAPGGPSVDGAGDLWIASGNSDSQAAFDHGNAVVELSPDLKELGYFAPADWAALNRADADLGSISPVVLDQDHVWMAGKGAEGYLLDAARPGGVGGQTFSGPVGCAAFGGTAYQAPSLYLACPSAVVAVRVDTGSSSFSVAWPSPLPRPAAPILAYGPVWVVATGRGPLTPPAAAGGQPSIWWRRRGARTADSAVASGCREGVG